MAVDALQLVEEHFEVTGDGALLVLEATKLAEQDEGAVAFDPGALPGGEHDNRALQLLERVGV
jgi:3-deoxy-D-manno-octulosonate 8-phosphate phosphatase KdsC-like HAD superfamily phosphatase